MNTMNTKDVLYRAGLRARKASRFAQKGRNQLQRKLAYERQLQNWGQIMENAPVSLFTVIFFVSWPTEILVSFEMYKEILSSYTEIPNIIFIWLLGSFIVGFAALTSHLLSKKISPELFRLEQYNLITPRSGHIRLLPIEATEKVKSYSLLQLGFGVISFLILVIIVGLISWQRSYLMAYSTGGIENDYSLFEKILPIVIVTVEVYTGIYLGYIIKKISILIRKSLVGWRAKKNLGKCLYETEMAYGLLEKGREENLTLTLNKDLLDVIFRMNFRSSSAPDYLEEIMINQCRIITRTKQEFLPNIRIVGLLNTSELTNVAYTSDQGVAIVYWNDDCPLKALEIGGQLFEGPFKNNTTHQFELRGETFLSFQEKQPSELLIP